MLLSIDYKVRQWSDRKEKSGSASFFNSYVFVQLEEKDREFSFQSAGAVRYLFWLGKPPLFVMKKSILLKLSSTRINAMFH
jgi:hypothetical protein